MSFGYIKCVNKINHYYEIAVSTGATIILLFEEVLNKRYKVGDFITFEIHRGLLSGISALNPKEPDPISIEELISIFLNKESVEAFIFKRLNSGFLVNYHGVICYLPDIYSLEYKNNQFLEINNLLMSYQLFNISSIVDGRITLAMFDSIDNRLNELIIKETSSISILEHFYGTVINVKFYGIFVQKKYTVGLLPVENVFGSLDLEQFEKKKLTKLLSDVFKKGRKISVFVKTIEQNNQYTLGWNKSDYGNKKILVELRQLVKKRLRNY